MSDVSSLAAVAESTLQSTVADQPRLLPACVVGFSSVHRLWPRVGSRLLGRNVFVEHFGGHKCLPK